MPSFDVVSEVDLHELTNAVDQANREVSNRFDFKGTDSRIEQNGHELTVIAPSDFQVKQVVDILHTKLVKREIQINSLEAGQISEGGNEARQQIIVRHGIDQDLARKIVKLVKQEKLKVQASIQGDQVRVNGKKRDDLQAAIAMLREADIGLPLQYVNFRD